MHNTLLAGHSGGFHESSPFRVDSWYFTFLSPIGVIHCDWGKLLAPSLLFVRDVCILDIYRNVKVACRIIFIA